MVMGFWLANPVSANNSSLILSLNLPFLLPSIFIISEATVNRKTLGHNPPQLWDSSVHRSLNTHKNYTFLTRKAALLIRESMLRYNERFYIPNWLVFFKEGNRRTKTNYIETFIVLISFFKLSSWKYPVEWVLVWITIMLLS